MRAGACIVWALVGLLACSAAIATPFRIDKGIVYNQNDFRPLDLFNVRGVAISPSDAQAAQFAFGVLSGRNRPDPIFTFDQIRESRAQNFVENYREHLTLEQAKKLLGECTIPRAYPVYDPEGRKDRVFVIGEYICPEKEGRRPSVYVTIGIVNHKPLWANIQYDVFIPINVDMAEKNG